MEGPDPDMQDERTKKESSWEAIREWFKVHKGISGNMSSPSVQPLCNSYDVPAKGQDLRLLLGVLGCPLAPISVVVSDLFPDDPLLGSFQIKNVPFVSITNYSLSLVYIYLFIFSIQILFVFLNLLYFYLVPFRKRKKKYFLVICCVEISNGRFILII